MAFANDPYFYGLGIIAYCVVRNERLKLPPLFIVIGISLMTISSVIGVVWMVHLSSHLFVGEFISCETLYLCMFPINYIICFVSVTRQVMQEYMEENKEINYDNTILNKFSLIMRNSKDWPIFAIVLALPILVITILVLVLFGQKPDAIIKAFTETSDWVLSQKISPPPIELEAKVHYLCTVSLRGHKSIVKPLRYGMRRDNKIVVNRQLCYIF